MTPTTQTVARALVAIWLAGCAPESQRPPPTAPAAQPDGTGESSVASPASPTVVLPLRQLDTLHIVLPVVIGTAEPLGFILDTGASMSVITPQTRDRLGLKANDGFAVEGKGAAGELNNVRVMILEQLSVGERSYEGHTVAVADLSHLESKLSEPIGGILGRNFLAQHVVEVDFPGREIRLHPADAVAQKSIDTSSLGAIEYQLFEAGGLIRIEVSLDDQKPMPAVLDLGAGRSLLNWRAAKRAKLTRRSKGLKKTKEKLMGADNKAISAVSYQFGSLAVGDMRFDKPVLYIADLQVFDTLGIGHQPAMIFGIDLLADRTIVLDYENQRVYLSRPGSE